ncbi:MAG: ABC transporter permease [Bacilli bacterium]|nr:ABC transporter permease [Bacilli bacterium]MBN2876879.1 ABC transporter permease [Bacilli bacterium]
MGFFDTLFEIIRLSLFVAIPLLVVALAGLFSERSGVVNIALEGIMVIGAFSSAFFMGIIYRATGLDGNWLFLIGIVIAIVFGILLSLLHAYASVNMNANQIISGTALNMFAPAFVVFIAQALTGYSKVQYPANSFFISETVFSNIPVLGPTIFSKTFMSVYIGFFLLIVAYIVLYKTRFGLRLRSCGEYPQASDAAGINVRKMRYIGVIISGGLAGLGGLFYIVPITGNYDANYAVYGYGFLALAVLISGQWKPFRILVVALLFGFVARIASMTTLIPFLENMNLSTELLYTIPYVVTIIVLAFTSKNSQAPKAAGEPYDAGKR